MDRRINPFNEAYLAETIPAPQFVRIFSPVMLENAEALFMPGNVILKGVQGSGKTMLLALLKPEVRIAYAEAGEKFPLKGQYQRFIGAGINLTRSGAVRIGQRKIDTLLSNDQETLAALHFADFINYFIVADLLRSIFVYAEQLNGEIAQDLGIRVDNKHLNVFARTLAKSESWFGYLDGVSNFQEMQARIYKRIQVYRSFFNYNTSIKDLPKLIQDTKTPIGQPISDTSEILTCVGIVPENVHIFIRIDQYEELSKIELKQNRGSVYRSVINTALGMRNPYISYRIGTRTYAFREDNLDLYSTSGRLERDRDYKVIDLDKILRRKENRRTWIFPDFAQDVFDRRLAFSGYSTESDATLEGIFGRGSTPEQRASSLCGTAPYRTVRLEDAWPDKWKEFLLNLSAENPLSARLAEAWARQKDKSNIVFDIPKAPYPWDGGKGKTYWRKERVQVALMQIAGRCMQRMIWGGKDDILELSGGNILVFVSLCQHIWAVWLRTAQEQGRSDDIPPKIEESVQSVGIHEASSHWFEKLSEEPNGNKRQRFVSYAGILLERKLFYDHALSNPGHNGFSLRIDQLDLDVKTRDFLNDAVDYGALFDSPHTTKLKDRKPRRKWYLNPILSPNFRIPHVHTKEPLYATINQIRGWIDKSVHGGQAVPQDDPGIFGSSDTQASTQVRLFPLDKANA